MRTLWLFLILTLIAPAALAQSELTDALKGILNKQDAQQAPEAGLSRQQMVGGFKEALAKGAELAVGTLGREDGFLANEMFRIPVPDSVEPLAKAARRLGQGKYVDRFELSLNRAAELAVPATLEVLEAAVQSMTVEDAVAILRGPDDAATRYFRETSGEAIEAAILPLVREATDSAGVTQAYKKLQDRGGSLLSAFTDSEETDLDAYVTRRSTDALFHYIAEQERQIRTDPLARTTDLLKAVFGRD